MSKEIELKTINNYGSINDVEANQNSSTQRKCVSKKTLGISALCLLVIASISLIVYAIGKDGCNTEVCKIGTLSDSCICLNQNQLTAYLNGTLSCSPCGNDLPTHI